jgi:hypothetical protein
MSNVAEAIATLSKVLREQPEKAQTKNAPMVVTDMPPQMGGVRAAQWV